MRLTREERSARRASFQRMTLADKAEYLIAYYKLPIVLGLAALLLFCSAVYRQVTRKEAVLYTAYVNISVGEDLESQLNEGFISASGAGPKRSEVYFYRGVYLSDDPSMENHEYGYASKLKVMAAIESKQLDIVLMNREAYDILSQKGFLLDFDSLPAPDGSLSSLLEPHLTANTVILEDNAIEYTLNEASQYLAVTEEITNGIDVSAFPAFQEAGFTDPVYLGVIANSPRFPAVIQFIEYLASM